MCNMMHGKEIKAAFSTRLPDLDTAKEGTLAALPVSQHPSRATSNCTIELAMLDHTFSSRELQISLDRMFINYALKNSLVLLCSITKTPCCLSIHLRLER